ncbi:hypothetical protein BGZ68_001409 [Mortierella alpina]|nr:hypothetical protein BGZ68_001409 [Mortierella alpina]
MVRSSLLPQDALDLAKLYLEAAQKADSLPHILECCTAVESTLSRIKKATKTTLVRSTVDKDRTLCVGIANVFFERGKLLESAGEHTLALVSISQAEGWCYQQGAKKHSAPSRFARSLMSMRALKPLNVSSVATVDQSTKKTRKLRREDIAQISSKIFPKNMQKPVAISAPPMPDQRIDNTSQLAFCLHELSKDPSPSCLPMAAGSGETNASNDVQQPPLPLADEKDRLYTLATRLVEEFMRDSFKDASMVNEVVCLAPVLKFGQYRSLLSRCIESVEASTLLNLDVLEGLAPLLQSASPGYLQADDLVRILKVLGKRLQDTHALSTEHVYRLTKALSFVLDEMADRNVKDLDRVDLHGPLSTFFESLQRSSDMYLIYYAAYAHQALQYVPDDDTPWRATLRRSVAVIKDASDMASAIQTFNLRGFIDGLEKLYGGMASMYRQAKTGYDDAATLIENGQGFLDSLKEGFRFRRKCAWYQALRGADSALRDGRLHDFKTLACEAPCRRHLAFQWGLCQRLGEMVVSRDWESPSKKMAIDFLGEIYKNDKDWGQHVSTRQWIASILTHVSSLSDCAMKGPASTLLQELKIDENKETQPLQDLGVWRFKPSIPLGRESSKLLVRVQDIPDVKEELKRLKTRRLAEESKSVYIPPQAKPGLLASDHALFPLMEHVVDFVDKDRRVMLLLGESGAGKSTFNRRLECELWRKYENMDRIPLLINLPAIDRPEQDMIAKHLRRNEFTDRQIRELKNNHTFILICDGYDESQQQHNLYTTNQLNEPGIWKATMVISCRTEFLGQDDNRGRFRPKEDQFQEAVIAPFTEMQIDAYIERYVYLKNPAWSSKTYRDALNKVPDLRELIKNPFLLMLSLEVLPQVVDIDQIQTLTAGMITRVKLYDRFIEHWLERGKRRVEGNHELSQQAKAAFNTLVDDGFTQNGISYLQRLAAAIYREQAGQPVVGYSRTKDEGTWKTRFFGRDDESFILREASPLARNGNQHRFIHRSLLEYCFSLAVFNPREAKTLSPTTESARRGSISSTFSFEHAFPEKLSTSTQQPIVEHPLSWKDIVGDTSLLEFLAERAQQEDSFKQQLLVILERSKTEKEARRAAANAITILVRAGFTFNQVDLSRIQVPGADLSGGQFDSADLQGTDLRKVKLRNIWLRQANLSNAKLAGAQFGEWPYLKEDGEVWTCAYSPDGEHCSVGLSNGTITVYDTTTWVKSHTLRGRKGVVQNVVYSPNGGQIASGTREDTVLLWDAQTGALGPTLRGHSSWITSVVYSPNGRMIASASSDMTVRVWDAQTGAAGPTLRGHTDWVMSVIYSPSGLEIVAGGCDNTVRLWDARTGAPGPTFCGHTEWVTSVMYSPRGHQVASSSLDMTVRLWDPKTGAPFRFLGGHARPVLNVLNEMVHEQDPKPDVPGPIESVASMDYSSRGGQIDWGTFDKTVQLWDKVIAGRGPTGPVMSVVYSPDGSQIASSSGDNTVRLWNVETGVPGLTLSGHSDRVTMVVYSPSGHQIASSSLDMTVRLWDVQTGAPNSFLVGHSERITEITYSPSSHQIASCSLDMTMRLWDAQAGATGHTVSGHTKEVTSVEYSPSGHQIASCSSDTTVRLWTSQIGALVKVLDDHDKPVVSVVYSPDGLSASADKNVQLRDAPTGQASLTLIGHTDSVTRVVYSPSGHQIASCSLDTTVRLWNSQTGAPVKNLDGHTKPVVSVAYSPDGLQIASGSYDKTVRIWVARTGARGHIFRGHKESVTSVVYSPSGHQVASSSLDMTVRLWNPQTGASGPVLSGHAEIVTRVMYSPNADQIASSSADNMVRLWDAKTGEPSFSLTGHTEEVICMVYSDSNRQIASGGKDSTVRLWDARTGEPGHILSDHTKEVTCVVYSQNNHQIISGGMDNTVRLWDVESGQSLTVIGEYRGVIRSIACFSDDSGLYFATGCDDKSVIVWHATKDESGYHISLHWSSSHAALVTSGTNIQDAEGLSKINAQLLKQRCAIGDPKPKFREVVDTQQSVKSAVSKWKELSNQSHSDPSSVISESTNPTTINRTPVVSVEGR